MKDSHAVEHPIVSDVLVKQGKYDCGAAALAILTGHTLFNVKRVLGDEGWRNDSNGVTDTILRRAAQRFHRDLVWCSKRAFETLIRMNSGKIPNSLITVPSLNYPDKCHAVAYYEGRVFDPNYGNPTRKYWNLDANVDSMEVRGASVLIDAPLSEFHSDNIRDLSRRGLYALVAHEVFKLIA